MVDEEDPLTIRQTAHDLHRVMMDFNWLAILVCTGDAPLRAAQSEVSRHSGVVNDDVHVRPQSDVACHGGANIVGAARHDGAAMHLLQANDAGFGVVHRCRGLDVLRVESSREPEVDEFW